MLERAPSVGDIAPLLAGVETLPGVGGKKLALLERLLDRRAPRIVDLLLHLPRGAIERRRRRSLAELVHDEHVVMTIRAVKHCPHRKDTRQPYVIVGAVEGGSERIELIQWPPGREAFARQMPIGATRRVGGRVKVWNGSWRLYPDVIEDDGAPSQIPTVEPLYALTRGITNAGLRKLIGEALQRLPQVEEWIDAALLWEHAWPGFAEALRTLHEPKAVTDVDPAGPAWSRLAFDELVAHQLPLARSRARMLERKKEPTVGDERISFSILCDLPFSLTASQVRAVEEIRADLAKPHLTSRLVQGDVGSGKTVVALLAAAAVAEAGRQAALMAPTEILARQHHETIEPLARAAGMRGAFLSGTTPAAERRATLAALGAGEVDLLVGTHALLEPEVTFRSLALAIVDEQQRFGREQRLALLRKGQAVDGLLLSATPIPQTMALALHGDLPVSELREKPAGRKPVDTRCVPLSRLDEVIAAVRREVERGGRVFWVCPLVERSERSALAAAEARADALRERFGGQVELVHGRIKAADREAAMARFVSGESQALVATTVIEVGVDVPAANVIVIEHAERFGLSQLHQLRGRVGRGDAQAYCILLHGLEADDETGRARLEILRETNDGFRIAEEDLRLRGAGDLFGPRQSGEGGLRIADLAVHTAQLKAATLLGAAGPHWQYRALEAVFER